MSGFQAVNATLAMENQFRPHAIEATTPTTPRPVHASTASSQQPQQLQQAQEPQQTTSHDESSPNTPTRNSFGGLTGQRPLPTSTFGTPPSYADKSLTEGTLKRDSSIHSRDSQDIEMGMEDSDDDPDGSEDESIADESGRPSKKKKGQRFFCTDFPPCTLSFTRSEHLARHIRKHTGERPFQCHCARRFSRLDNLRQHAQTVHVNEEIPTDSLAATGTRFQRQVRTDRVRPSAGRSRASTVGSQTGHSRGHSRNLSSSSIGSGLSNLSMRDDVRRRPPPLIMANDPSSRTRLSIDTFKSPPDSPSTRDPQYRGYPAQSPGGYSTPTSSTFSTGPASPHFGSALQSPSSRPSSMWGPSTPGRRLSVPSGANPFQSPQGGAQAPTAYFSPLPSSTASNFSGQSSMFGSPISSVFNNREFASRAAQDAEFKRRTWHPESRSNLGNNGNNGNGAGLAKNSFTHYHTNTMNRPSLLHSHSSGMGTRLPGIESFDREHSRPPSPPRRGPSPMQVDPAPQRPPSFPGVAERAISGPDDRRGLPEWDMSLHRNLTRLDISTSTPPKDSPPSWPIQTNAGPDYHTMHQSAGPAGPSRHSMPQVHRYAGMAAVAPAQQVVHPPPQRVDAPASSTSVQSPTTPRRNKRHGWYNGPIHAQKAAAQRTSPEDSSSSEGVPTPSTSSVGEYNPSIVHSDGRVENNSGVTTDGSHQTYAPDHSQAAVPGSSGNAVAQAETPKGEGDLVRLEALVAAATSNETPAEKTF